MLTVNEMTTEAAATVRTIESTGTPSCCASAALMFAVVVASKSETSPAAVMVVVKVTARGDIGGGGGGGGGNDGGGLGIFMHCAKHDAEAGVKDGVAEQMLAPAKSSP